jgi:hypothetical protein
LLSSVYTAEPKSLFYSQLYKVSTNKVSTKMRLVFVLFFNNGIAQIVKQLIYDKNIGMRYLYLVRKKFNLIHLLVCFDG